jgi:hypothetical protein
MTGTAIAPFNRGRMLTGAIGQYLNLLLIWGSSGCGDDRVADTPVQAGPNTGIPSFPHITSNNGPNGDMFMNFMDYVDDEAMLMFTRGQAQRMQETLRSSRSQLLKKKGPR